MARAEVGRLTRRPSKGPGDSQHGHQQKSYRQQVLERVWRKGSPLALWVGM